MQAAISELCKTHYIEGGAKVVLLTLLSRLYSTGSLAFLQNLALTLVAANNSLTYFVFLEHGLRGVVELNPWTRSLAGFLPELLALNPMIAAAGFVAAYTVLVRLAERLRSYAMGHVAVLVYTLTVLILAVVNAVNDLFVVSVALSTPPSSSPVLSTP
ncbi:MAG: hypothetical protein DRO39_04060 [Thermoprotei archaeon]|nr:MAG: hypothetical protein DRO39_04060 [Thermoprotei archaeon]